MIPNLDFLERMPFVVDDSKAGIPEKSLTFVVDDSKIEILETSLTYDIDFSITGIPGESLLLT